MIRKPLIVHTLAEAELSPKKIKLPGVPSKFGKLVNNIKSPLSLRPNEMENQCTK